MPPRCMNAVCCWLPPDRPGAPSIGPSQTSVTLRGEATSGAGRVSEQREQRRGGFSSDANTKGRPASGSNPQRSGTLAIWQQMAVLF